MNEDLIKGKVKQVQGELKRQWGRMTDDSESILEGTGDKIAGKMQEGMGKMRHEGDQMLHDMTEDEEL